MLCQIFRAFWLLMYVYEVLSDFNSLVTLYKWTRLLEHTVQFYQQGNKNTQICSCAIKPDFCYWNYFKKIAKSGNSINLLPEEYVKYCLSMSGDISM